jgi:hypothetical protein
MQFQRSEPDSSTPIPTVLFFRPFTVYSLPRQLKAGDLADLGRQAHNATHSGYLAW